MKRWLFLITILIATTGTSLFGCELPAHPSAAAIPALGTPGAILVEEGNSFYYLMPEGANARMKIVWDPAMHNRPSGLNADEYQGIVKEGIARDPEVPEINGAGFFKLEAMSAFFKAKGNRGDIKEAFARESGADLSKDFVPDMALGPYAGLSQFAKADNEQEFSIIGGNAPGYGGTPSVSPGSITDEKVTVAVNTALPSTRWHDDNSSITLENDTNVAGNFFNGGDGLKIKYHDCGIYMQNLDIKVTQIEPQKYKAYIDGNNKAAQIHTEGIGNSPETGAPGPEFNLTFSTPTISDSKTESIIKIKVESPPAGYELTNLFWVWEEDVYKYKEKDIPVLDASGTQVLNPDGSPKVITKKFYQVITTGKKCSTGLKLVVYKPAKSQGFSAFRVYDTHGPIASNLVLDKTSFDEANSTAIGFTLDIVDSNPFAHLTFSENTKGKDLSQNIGKMGLEIFYTYPTYHYIEAAAPSFASLNNHGLADLSAPAGTTPSFTTYKHETKWFWKAAETTVSNIVQLQELKNGDGKIIGSISRISGNLVIKNPKPWHEYSDGPPKFAIFAMTKDTAGKSSMIYSGVVGPLKANVNTPNEKANLTEARTYAFNPADGQDIPCNDGPTNKDDLLAKTTWAEKAEWQKLNYLEATDNIGPEIQVIVFDTRTNRYHVFGTKKNVAYEMSKSANKALNDYAALAEPPYLNKKIDIDSKHEFTNLANLDDLFMKYLQGPNAVSTVSDDTNIGFVCQKNSRLLFYGRAFDNDGYMDGDGGITAFSMALNDKYETKNEGIMLKPIEHVFRYENVAAGAVSPYVLTINATDKKNNSRKLLLNIGVMGRTLEIRTLEERRDRID